MSTKIKVIKGFYGKIRISSCTLALLKPLIHDKGVTLAQVNAEPILGTDYKNITIQVDDYVCLS